MINNCELCSREREVTFHHLIPKETHHKSRIHKDMTGDVILEGFNEDELTNQTNRMVSNDIPITFEIYKRK